MKRTTISLPEKLRHTASWKSDCALGLLRKPDSYAIVSIGLDGKIGPLHEFADRPSFANVPDWRSASHRPAKLNWLFQRQSIFAIDSEGKLAATIDLSKNHDLALLADEEIGVMLTTDNSLFLSISRGLNNSDKHSPKYDLASRLVKLSSAGEFMWSTRLQVDRIACDGTAYASAATNWKPETCPPWFPTTWKPFGHDLLVVSGDRIMATFAETRSGVGIRYVLETDSGKLKWKSDPSAGGHSVSIGAGGFLIGDQGYGHFKTTLFRGDKVNLSWPSHGQSFCSGDKFLSIQMANVPSQPQRLVEMKPDGTIAELSQPLGGYYTSRLQRAADGAIYFWRANKIWKWSPVEGIRHVSITKFHDSAFATSLGFGENRFGFHVRSDGHHTLLVWAN